jgi:hypothetical protein
MINKGGSLLYHQNSNPYGYRSKPKKTFLHKLSKQLVAVLIMMLMLMLLKYTNTDSTQLVTSKIKAAFYADYTTNTTLAIKTYSPSVKDIVGNLLDRYSETNEPEDETVPVNASN